MTNEAAFRRQHGGLRWSAAAAAALLVHGAILVAVLFAKVSAPTPELPPEAVMLDLPPVTSSAAMPSSEPATGSSPAVPVAQPPPAAPMAAAPPPPAALPDPPPPVAAASPPQPTETVSASTPENAPENAPESVPETTPESAQAITPDLVLPPAMPPQPLATVEPTPQQDLPPSAEPAARRRVPPRPRRTPSPPARPTEAVRPQAATQADAADRPSPPATPMTASPPSRPAPNPAEIASWQSALLSRLQAAKQYPEAARSRGDEGVAVARFTMDRAGRVLAAALVRSSGSAPLDEEALAMIRRAAPLPVPPAAMEGATITLTVPVNFSLR